MEIQRWGFVQEAKSESDLEGRVSSMADGCAVPSLLWKPRPNLVYGWAITEPSMSGLSPSAASAFAFGGEGFGL